MTVYALVLEWNLTVLFVVCAVGTWALMRFAMKETVQSSQGGEQ